MWSDDARLSTLITIEIDVSVSGRFYKLAQVCEFLTISIADRFVLRATHSYFISTVCRDESFRASSHAVFSVPRDYQVLAVA